jgi:cyclohexanecarboxylate-CoA ligase
MALAPTWQSPQRFPEREAIDAPTPELLHRYVAAAPGRVAVVDADHQVNARELLAAVAWRQRQLAEAGVGRGDVVCGQLPNWWESVALAHAVWGMGAVLCPVPVNYRAAEITAILSAVPVAAYVSPQRYRGTDYARLSSEAMSRAGSVMPALDLPHGPYAAAGGPLPPDAAELAADLDAVCLLMFTSGTTGRPKGVLHSHRTLLTEARSIAGLFGLDGDRVYMPSPIGHITGLVYGVVMPLLMNGSVVLQAEWDAQAGLELIEGHGCTFCVGATPFLRGLTDAYTAAGHQSRLTGFVCGGADVPPSLVAQGRKALGATVVRAYGLTEMPTVSCGGPADPPEVLQDTDGSLTGSSAARLTSESDGTGELEVRGPELCLGYLDPADTAASFTADGWFRTGDLARLGPGGTVTIAGRVKDIVVRGGENISGKEVEDYLVEHPQIAEVAIVGVPDEVLGERACAVVIARGAAPALADITAFLISRDIARHKIPEHLIITAELPRTASGKIQKFVVRQNAISLLASGQGESRFADPAAGGTRRRPLQLPLPKTPLATESKVTE